MAIFTGRVERAIALALEAHQGQVRKGNPDTPSVAHPVTVALILSRYSDDEDVIVAGLLHDTLEDTGVDETRIAREFGDRVLAMVRDVTEPRLPGLSWETRTARYLRQLAQAPRGSLLVAGADKIASLVSLIAAHAAGDESVGARFDAPPAQTLALYRQVYEVLRGAWPTCPLLREFRGRLEEAERKLLRRP